MLFGHFWDMFLSGRCYFHLIGGKWAELSRKHAVGGFSDGRFFVVTLTRLRKLHPAAFFNLFLHPITAVSLRCFVMLMPGHKPHHGPRNCGFTLVELLVVIAILALLLSLILTALARARANASAVACCAHLRQIGVAFAVYANDNGGKLRDP